jgi:hypothetical protein
VVKNWILSGDYKKSWYSFKAPPVMRTNAFVRQKYYSNYEAFYMHTFGPFFDQKLEKIASLPLISLIYKENYMKDD